MKPRPSDKLNLFGVETVDLNHLSADERKIVESVLREYSDVFQDPRDNKLACTSRVKHRIDTGDARPIKKNPYRLPHNLKGKV